MENFWGLMILFPLVVWIGLAIWLLVRFLWK